MTLYLTDKVDYNISMAKNHSITILGSGTSTGVPIPGCTCKVCQSPLKENKRLRTSFFIESSNGSKVIIDTGPDLRTQLLREGITDIDAAIITHEHADHLHGIDDLRPFCFLHNKEIPVYTSAHTIESMTNRFPYIFDESYFTSDRPHIGGGVPKLKLHELKPGTGEVKIANDEFYFELLPHGYGQTLLVGFEKMAIAIDCHEIPENVLKRLEEKNLDLLIIDCVREKPHKTHLSLEKSFSYIKQIGAKRSVLVHMGHELDHEYLSKKCYESFKESVFPGHDSMRLSF